MRQCVVQNPLLGGVSRIPHRGIHVTGWVVSEEPHILWHQIADAPTSMAAQLPVLSTGCDPSIVFSVFQTLWVSGDLVR